LDPDRPPSPYYLRTVRGATIDLARRELRHREQPKRLPRHEGDGSDDVEMQDMLEALLRPLSGQQGELFRSRYLLGRSPAEIAEERRLTVAQVYRLLHEGRTRVRAWAIEKGYSSAFMAR
jgi:DNA-directed RNA polymerase specialized sigma24 family protein